MVDLLEQEEARLEQQRIEREAFLSSLQPADPQLLDQPLRSEAALPPVVPSAGGIELTPEQARVYESVISREQVPDQRQPQGETLFDYYRQNFPDIDPESSDDFNKIKKLYIDKFSRGLSKEERFSETRRLEKQIESQGVFAFQDLIKLRTPVVPKEDLPEADETTEARAVEDRRGISGAVENFYASYGRGITKAFSDVPRIAGMLTKKEGLINAADWIDSLSTGEVDPEFAESLGGIISSGLGQVTGLILASVFPGGGVSGVAKGVAPKILPKLLADAAIKSSTKVIPLISTASTGAVGQVQDYYNVQREKGLKVEPVKELLVAGAGALIGATDIILPTKILGGNLPLKKVDDIVSKYLKGNPRIASALAGGITELSQESFQSAASEVAAKLIYAKDVNLGEALRQVGEEGGAGGIVGAIIGAALPGKTPKTTKPIDQNKVEETKDEIKSRGPELDKDFINDNKIANQTASGAGPNVASLDVQTYLDETAGAEIPVSTVATKPLPQENKIIYSADDVSEALSAAERLQDDKELEKVFGNEMDAIQLGEFSVVYNNAISKNKGLQPVIKWLKNNKDITNINKDIAIQKLEDIDKPLRSGFSYQDSSRKNPLTGLTNNLLIEDFIDRTSALYRGLPTPAAERIAALAQGNKPEELISELRSSAKKNPDNETQLLIVANQLEQMAQSTKLQKQSTEKTIKEFQKTQERLTNEFIELQAKIQKQNETDIAEGKVLREEVEKKEQPTDRRVPREPEDNRFTPAEEALLRTKKEQGVISPEEQSVRLDRLRRDSRQEKKINEIEKKGDIFAETLKKDPTVSYTETELAGVREDYVRDELAKEGLLLGAVGEGIKIPLTQDSATLELQDRLGADNTANLISSGKLSIVESPDNMPDNIRDFYFANEEKTAAVYDRTTDTVYLMPQNIDKGNAFNIMAHEITHARHDDIWGTDTGKRVFDSFTGKKETDSKVRAAYAKVPEWTREADIDNEALAYYVQDVANATQPLYRRAITEIKRLLVEYLGISPNILNEADIGTIYSSAVHKFARDAAKNEGATIFEKDDPIPAVINNEEVSTLQASTMDGEPKSGIPEEPIGENELNDPKKMSRMERWARQNLKYSGLLEAVFGKEGDKAVTKWLNNNESASYNASNHASNTKKAIEAYYGKTFKGVTKKEQRLFTEALSGNDVALAEITANDADIGQFVSGERRIIDSLSVSLMNALDRNAERIQERIERHADNSHLVGQLEGQLKQVTQLRNTIQGNLSHYLNTAYEAYNNPYYLKKIEVGTDRNNQFRAQFAAELIADGIDVKRAAEIANETSAGILKRLRVGQDLSQYFGTSRIYRAKNGGLSPAIKEFLGEVEDPTVIVNQTISKMRKQLATNMFHTTIMNLGRATGMVSDTVFDNSVLYGQESLNVFSPLNGLYVDRDIEQGFSDMNVQPVSEGIGGFGNLVQSIFRIANVPLNAVVYPTAAIGNLTYFITNGMLNPSRHLEAGRIEKQLVEQFGKKKVDELMVALGMGTTGGLAEDLEIRLDTSTGYLDELVADKISRAAGAAGRLVGAQDVDTKVANWGESAIELYTKLLKYPIKAYGSIDPYFKRKAFFYNLSEIQVAKAGKWTQTQMMEEAADITNKTFQNYNRLPKLIRQTRLFTKGGGWRNAMVPFTNTFISFAGDVGRMTWDTAVKSYELYQDPDTRPMAKRMLFGQAMVYGSLAALAQGLFNDDEDAKQLKGFWAEGDIGFLSGEYMYNMQYVLPQSMIAKLLINPTIELMKLPITAVKSPAQVERDLTTLLDAVGAGIVSEFGNDMTTQVFSRAAKEASQGLGALDRGRRFFDSLASETVKGATPGFAKHAERIYLGLKNRTRGYLNERSMPYDVEDELLKLIGIRRYPATYYSTAQSNAYDLRNKINDQNKQWKNILTDINRFDTDYAEGFLETAQEDWNVWWAEQIETKNVFVQPGKMTRKEYEAALNDSKANKSILSKEQITYLMNDRIPPLKLSGRDVVEAEKVRKRGQIGQVYDRLQIEELASRLDANYRKIRPLFQRFRIRER